MSRQFSTEMRVLAIDPSSRGLGFAVLEGPERLLDWGVKQAKGDKNAQCLIQIAALIGRYQPEVIVIEDYTSKDCRRCLRVRELIRDIIVLAVKMNIKSCRISRRQVQKAFSQSGVSNKHQIATVIAEILPELALRLPPFRKPWMSEDARMGIFDAVAFGLTFFQNEDTW